MSLKSGVAWAIAVVALVGAGVVAKQALDEAARKNRIEQDRQRSRTHALLFADCVMQQLSDAGMRELIIHQYKPAGIAWQSLKKAIPAFTAPPMDRDLQALHHSGMVVWRAHQVACPG